MSTARRILIVRLSAIGDVVFASPLIAALRRTWPDAHIAWLAEPHLGDLLEEYPDLDEFIPWPRGEWSGLWKRRQWRTLWRRVAAFRRRLRAARFDLVLDTQGLLKSGILAALTGAPERVGLGSREGSQWFMTRTLDRKTESRRPGAEYRKLAEALRLDTADFRMRLPISQETRERAAAILAGRGVSSPYAVLAAFTTRPQKHWFEERWAELARRLQTELGLSPVLLGAEADRTAGIRIAEKASPIVDLTGASSLQESAAIVSAARLLVGVDTGLTHMGIAANIPTVALFGSTRPYLETGTDSAVVLYRALPCSPCKRSPSCHGSHDCMRAHSVDDVMQTAGRLLSEQS